MPEERYTFDRVVRMVVGGLSIVAVLALMRYLSDVLLPFVAAAVLAYLLNPIVCAFEHKTHRRGLSVGITLGGLGIVATGIILVLIPIVVSQVGRFQDDLSKLRGDLTASMSLVPLDATEGEGAASDDGAALEEKSALGLTELKRAFVQYRTDPTGSRAERLSRLFEAVEGTTVGEFLVRARKYVKSEAFDTFLIDAAKKLAVGGWSVLTFAVNLVLGLTGLIVVLLYLVFLLLDYPEYARTWQTFLPPKYRDPIVEFLEQFDIILRRYFRGQSVVALLVGTLFAIGFTLIGLPMAVPLGLFVGLLNMVPYLQTVGLVPAIMLAGLRAVEGDSSFVVSVALTVVVFGVVQLIQDALITPRIVGQATGLRPVAILLGVFIWGKLLGFMGLLLAIPLTCLGIAYYRRFVLLHRPETTRITDGP